MLLHKFKYLQIKPQTNEVFKNMRLISIIILT